MTLHFDENEIARQAKEWTKEDVIEVIKSWQMADEFFQEEHIGNSDLKKQIEGSQECLAIIIEFINTRCTD
ncbi:hypothetical protein [Acinetobacter pittii]|uniref:hypothetical protein n=1 Tax=Acinetobacter pittii TaxID=48296 RepID=UPI003260E7F3